MIKNDLEIGIPTTVEWESWNGEGRCPKCFGARFQYNTRVVLTTQPAQTLLRCLGCGYQFGNLALVRSRSESTEPSLTNKTTDACVLCGEAIHVGGVFCENCLKALRGVVKRATQPISANIPHIQLPPVDIGDPLLTLTESEPANSVTVDNSDVLDLASVIVENTTEAASTNEASATVTTNDSSTPTATEEADVAAPETAAPKKRSTYKRKTPSTEG